MFVDVKGASLPNTKQRKLMLKSALAQKRQNLILAASKPSKMRNINILQETQKVHKNKIKSEEQAVVPKSTEKSPVPKVAVSEEGSPPKEAVSGKSLASHVPVSEKTSPKAAVSPKSPTPKVIGINNGEVKKVVNEKYSAIATEPISDSTNVGDVSGEVNVLTVEQINRQGETRHRALGEVKKTEENQRENEPGEGYFELNKLMTKVLNEEIEDMMMKVVQVVLDNPTTASEILVADKLRTEVAPHLQTTLGLNTTKRLLNVYNPLFVKIQFSCRPEAGTLVPFLNKYNIKKFKRIESENNTFAAELKDIADFDALCTAENVTCGSAKIKITPCYKFTQCPSKLKTQYDGQVNDNDLTDYLMLDEENKEANTKIKMIRDNDIKESKSDVPKLDGLEPKNSQTKDTIKSNNIGKLEIPLKIENEASENINVLVNEDTKALETSIPVDIKTGSPRNAELKTNAEAKKNKAQIVKPQTKMNKNTNIEKKTFESKRKKRGNSNSFKIIDESVTEEFDDEEMNDEDILALLSGKGVVLDECGSCDE